jgi:hypothetical protein
VQEGLRQEAGQVRQKEEEKEETHPAQEEQSAMRRRIATALAAALALALSAASPASAAMQINSFATISSVTQAGGHPDLETTFALDEPGVQEAARNVRFDAPEGLFGNINAVTNCQPAEFALAKCPPNSQVGLITVYANYSGDPSFLLGTAPLYDVTPQADQTALLQFIVPTLGIPISIPITVRTGSDYGLRFTVSSITQLTPLASAHLTVWGFPAGSSHQFDRFRAGSPGAPAGCPGLANASCNPTPTMASIPNHPFTDNPTTCSGLPLVTELDVETYQDPGNFTHAESSYPAMTGCEKETFKPLLQGQPTTNETDSPSGLDLNLSAEQFVGFAASPSQIKSAVVTLPEGLTINPDAADGQSACADSQANFGSEGPANCPDNAKIGTLSVGSPTLDGRLTGSLYFGEPKPGDQYRLFMIFDGFGMHAKLVGSARPDPQTGQVTVYFEDLPQVPFEDFDIHLFASDRGLVATPIRCTVYDLVGRFFPWNGTLPDQTSIQHFSLTQGPHSASCPGLVRPFTPRLEAGTSNPVAGAFSNFHLKLDRDDGDQFLGDLNFRMPPGFTGDLRGIAYCPEASILAAATKLGRAEQASASCPASSQIGTTNVAAGPGSHPFHAIGRMYLSGPFKGAPLSLAAITPALAGPYDYGVVVVRVALHVDPLTAQVSAISDTVPAIIGGVPIRMRSIQVNIDRPNFTINPTNCSAFSVDSQGIGDQGTVTDFFSYFNAVNCATLPFKPKMTMRQVGNRKQTRRATNPRLQLDLRTRPGDANIKALTVTLSSAFEIDQRHLGNICSEKELSETQCAGRTPIGTASTTTPLLDQPLQGPVYAVSGSGGLPRLAFILNGQVDLIPRADTKTASGGRLQTTAPVIPDAPIGHFRLTVFGGKTGYLVNTRNICEHTPVTKVAYTAQSGKTHRESIKVRAACGKKKHRRRRAVR